MKGGGVGMGFPWVACRHSVVVWLSRNTATLVTRTLWKEGGVGAPRSRGWGKRLRNPPQEDTDIHCARLVAGTAPWQAAPPSHKRGGGDPAADWGAMGHVTDGQEGGGPKVEDPAPPQPTALGSRHQLRAALVLGPTATWIGRPYAWSRSDTKTCNSGWRGVRGTRSDASSHPGRYALLDKATAWWKGGDAPVVPRLDPLLSHCRRAPTGPRHIASPRPRTGPDVGGSKGVGYTGCKPARLRHW
jgi:hypothetical protein